MLLLLAALAIRFERNKLITLLKTDYFRVAGVTMASLIGMTAAFGALLEVRGLEETMLRTITRYWEYSAGFVLSAAIIHLAVTRDERLDRGRSVILPIALATLGAIIMVIPREQTQADSALLYPGVLIVVPLLLAAALFVRVFASESKASIAALASLSILVLVGSASTVKAANYLHAETAGVIVGRELAEILKIAPEDEKRIIFMGESSAINSAAFQARLPQTSEYEAGFYSRVPYDDLPGSPRWVVASKEVFVLGEPVSQKIYGDMVIYEFGFPAQIQAIDFQKLGVESTGTFLNTFWGAWIGGLEFSFVVPEDLVGDTLEISLLVNDELENSLISIDFGEGPIQGEIEKNQILTPVTLTRPGGGNWGGTQVKVSYLGALNEIAGTRKLAALGFGGFKVYRGSGSD